MENESVEKMYIFSNVIRKDIKKKVKIVYIIKEEETKNATFSDFFFYLFSK